MAALRSKLSAELLPIDKKCLLACAAGALAVYSAFVAAESKTSFASVLQDASWLPPRLCAAPAGAALINFAAAA